MRSFLNRVWMRSFEIFKSRGLVGLSRKIVSLLYQQTLSPFSYLYCHIFRPALPITGYVKRNGILTGGEEIRAADDWLPSPLLPSYISSSRPNFSVPQYEEALSRGLRNYVQNGDNVVVVGGGMGITSVIAAEQVGETGRVEIFEGSKERVAQIRETLKLNGVEQNARVNHSIVETAVSVWGEQEGREASILPSKALPDCEVLELDCEGAEIEILQNMQAYPRVVLVESHGMLGSSTTKVKSELQNQGYEIQSVEPANRSSYSVDNDIKVVCGTLNEY